MSIEISLGLWQDRPPAEALGTARLAGELGFPALWIGEMATYDAFALAAAAGPALPPATRLVLGPFAVTVRDPMMIAMGAASVAALTGLSVSVALGTSSPVVVEQWHGRSRAGSAQALETAARSVRALLAGERVGGYRLRLPPVEPDIVVAAFGPRAVTTAARHADRMVLNLLDPPTAGDLVRRLRAADGRRPRVAAWAPAAIGSDLPAAYEQLRRGVVGYLAAPGYCDMFVRAGFGDVVEFARTGPHPRELLAAIPDALVDAVGVVGDRDAARQRIAAYREHGVDDVVLVPASTDADPLGAATLAAARELLRECDAAT
ncbi:LLM class F420-dependent oxidoreductase [Dactylosporangium matsuzakiense]|uniref:LLM class F420-dependent oxidoreductase n=1 Tax=Dactylosporangium matsuzakiense TaxID=53360 RepID=A0A9W6KRQ3_9ACTN|nr:LLM class F420-dependent oxidoreductase [Dactylosporangium matsuzakiense]UWZ47431.1 LLM class F420-dependent oxidoreductase [Dactylosporangium matsuzakiense]GLL05180.1 LLM class F420-dependent oxidoreductase [Dactylosporangium matsuzakiense]